MLLFLPFLSYLISMYILADLYNYCGGLESSVHLNTLIFLPFCACMPFSFTQLKVATLLVFK